VISPLLALLHMRRVLLAWQRWEKRLQVFVCTYADDLVILCRGAAEQALVVTRELMRRIKLELNEEKTRTVNAQMESLDFLGYTFGPMHNPKNGARYLGAAPSKARVRRLRQVVHCYDSVVKLAALARQTGIHPKTAYRWFDRGVLPIPTRRLPTGTIWVDAPQPGRDGKTALYARVSSPECSSSSTVVAMCIAAGNVSFEDWLRLTSSFGWIGFFDRRYPR